MSRTTGDNRTGKRFAWLVSLGVVTASPLPAQLSPAQRLPQLQQQVERQQRETERLRREESALRTKLQRIERELARARTSLRKLQGQIQATERERERAENQLVALGGERAAWQRRTAQGVHAYYTTWMDPGRLFPDLAVEGAQRQLLQREALMVHEVVVQERQVEILQRQLLTVGKRLERLRIRAAQEEAAHQTAQRQHQILLQTTAGRRVAAEGELRRLQESARALRELIGREEAKRKRIPALPREIAAMREGVKKRRGTFPWPVEGEVVQHFGKRLHAELNTPIISNGIKIQTAPGVAVRAVDPGKVLYAGEFRSYGRMVVLGHRGGLYSVYGLLGEVTTMEGQTIARQEMVGRASPHGVEGGVVYFELRWENEPLNPVDWLEIRGRKSS